MGDLLGNADVDTATIYAIIVAAIGATILMAMWKNRLVRGMIIALAAVFIYTIHDKF